MLFTLLFLSTILTLAGFLSAFGWIFDLASHFRLQYVFLQLVCIVLCIALKRWKLLIFAIACLSVNAALIIPFYIRPPQDPTPKDTQKLSILLINLNAYNTEHDKVIAYIDRMDPDILALEELNGRWGAALQDIIKRYPFYQTAVREDCFGIGFYSKLPPKSMEVKYYGTTIRVPSVLVSYSFLNEPLTVLLTHPLPPGSLSYFRWRNEQLENIIKARPSFEKKLIVVGDLNTASWSHAFGNFIKNMQLTDTRRGFGLQNSWPENFPSIAIDHILASEGIRTVRREIGPDIGSDHRPVYAELIF